MPKYNFFCEICKKIKTFYVPVSEETRECDCGNLMIRKLPKISDLIQVKELVDPYLNKSLNKDHDLTMKERKENFFWDVEVPRLIEKYSLETCLEHGWLKYNDKGELIINKKPSKR